MQDKKILSNKERIIYTRLSGRRHPASEKTTLNDPAKVKSFRDRSLKYKWTKQDLLELEEELKK